MTSISIKVINEFLKGKFYFRKSEVNYELLPDKLPAKVSLFIGKESKTSIPANLIDSGKEFRRVHKVALKNWFIQEDINEGDYFKIDIIDKTTFRIYK